MPLIKKSPCRYYGAYAGCVLLCWLRLHPVARADIRISEFVADNSGALLTVAGETADWIELHNSGTNEVDLGGWYLTDNRSAPTKWRFPDGTRIASNGYFLVFADSSPVSLTNGELHANFSLSAGGEYLGLVRPDGVTVEDSYEPLYPQQYEDISYGRVSRERELVGAGAPARYLVPDAAGTSLWTSAHGALGFCGTNNAAFTVSYYELTGAIANVNIAEAMLTNRAGWKTDRAYPIVGHYGTVDFHESSSSGSFTNNLLFPGLAAGQNKSYYMIAADTAIYVPQAGQWTFCVGSDDGFRLRISGHGVSFVSEYATGRGFGNTLSTFTFPAAGIYALNLVYFENTGGATVEFSVAQGFQSAFLPDVFRLTGDPEGGILHAGAIGAFVETDVGDAMRATNTRLEAEWPFTLVTAPDLDDTFTLLVRCADGFSASLNGTPLASLNMPDALTWNSAATATRTLESALLWIACPVPSALLAAGTNVLSITALNDSVNNTEFLIQPRLTWRTAECFPGFFKTPTPGAANGRSYTAPTPKVAASEPRGYKTAPFSVTLSCEADPEAVIRYTLDGSTPCADSPCYSLPLSVTNTTILRAAVVDPEALRVTVKTVSWLFLEDLLLQKAAVPSGWPTNGQVNAHVMEYGMREAIVTGDPVRLRNGMTNAIPSISLVTDLTNLFSAATGIYVNPGNDGLEWERPVSVELIDPVKGTNSEFRIDAGLRIRGAFSRSVSNPKHSFRLFFRSDYGEGKLRFPLFGDEGASEFDKIDLRTSQNYSWSYPPGNNSETFVRETFSRDSQRDMGMPYTRSRYYHLYLNGQYWGLYQTQERGDADFAETYLGGDNDQWDCIKTTIPGYTTTAADGTFDAFYAFHDLAVNQGFAGTYSNNYWRARGLNPDGTSNTDYPVYLDQDNLIAYMLIAYYTGDPDSPISIWGGMPNNMYGLFNRVAPDGFKWLRHDAEHSLGANGGYGVTCDTTYAGTNFTTQSKFNPATLHQRLCQHPDYLMRFVDLTHRHLYGDGALTPTNAQMRFRSRMSEIDLAIIGESARWGRGRTRDATWIPACSAVLNTYLTQRRDILVNHLRNRGWYPWLEAPTCSTNRAVVPFGFTLRLSATNAFWYTTDGTDPRLPGGGINPAAVAVTRAAENPLPLISRNAIWRYCDTGAEPAATNGLTWRDATYPDGAWPQGPAILGFAGSAPINAVATRTKRYVNGTSGPQVTTTYFRHAFVLDSCEGLTNLLVSILRDDGASVYLNGTEILREIMPSGALTYTNYSSATVVAPDQTNYLSRMLPAASLLQAGTNVLAVEVHQCNATSSDLYFDVALSAAVDTSRLFAHINVTNNLSVFARAFDGTNWSALAESALSLYRPLVDYAPLRVAELMYAPPAPEAGSPYVNDDFSWIELRNTGSSALDLDGVSFVAGINHTFAPLALAPGTRLVLSKNPGAFAQRYNTNGIMLVTWTGGNLARKGETLKLVTPATNNLLTFSYSNLWYPETYNTGRSLVAVDLAAEEPVWSTALNWRPSRALSGTPGFPDAPCFTTARVTADRRMQLEALGLDGSISLWFSEDLTAWTPCEAGVWSQTGGVLSIDLQHPSLPAGDRGFFQIRLAD